MAKKQQKPPVPKRNSSAQAVARTLPQQLLTVQKQELFQGPIPHPDLLKKYDEVVLGAAERILRLAEEEQQHRHEMDLNDADNNKKLLQLSESEISSISEFRKRGQLFGFVICVICVLAAFYATYNQMSWKIIVAFLTLPTASLIRAFFTPNNPRDSKDKVSEKK